MVILNYISKDIHYGLASRTSVNEDMRVRDSGVFLLLWTLLWGCGPQQTQNICITFVQRRPNIFDVGPTLYKCFVFTGTAAIGTLYVTTRAGGWAGFSTGILPGHPS